MSCKSMETELRPPAPGGAATIPGGVYDGPDEGVRMRLAPVGSLVLVVTAGLAGCQGKKGEGGAGPPGPGPGPVTAPSCVAAPGGGTPMPSVPTLLLPLVDRFHEAWVGSPAVADLDRDGKMEIVLPREQRLLVFASDGALRWSASVGGRIWSSPVTADFVGDN